MPLGRMGRPGLIGMAARTAVVAGTATAVSGRVQRRQQEKYAEQSQQQAEQAAQQRAAMEQAAAAEVQMSQASGAAPRATDDDMIAQLDRLAQLHAQGVLSDGEFAAAKAKLLS